MKKRAATKLSLNSETLLRLDGRALRPVRGAVTEASVCDPRGHGQECSGGTDCSFSCFYPGPCP
jgi:hypothetical protein